MTPSYLSAGSSYTTPSRAITESDIDVFGALTGIDPGADRSGKGAFSGIIAHALLVLSYGIELAMPDPSRVIALRALREVVFKRPIRPGDSIRVALKVESVKPLPGQRELVTMTWRILNQSDVAVARAVADFVCTCAVEQDCGRPDEGDLDEITIDLIPV